MIFSYGLVLALFLLAPGLGLYAGLYAGAHRGAFRPAAPSPGSVLTLGIIVLGALFAHTAWALVCAANDAWTGAGLPAFFPPTSNAYDVLLGAVVEHHSTRSGGIAVFLLTSSLLTAATFLLTAWIVESPPARQFYGPLVYGWLADIVEAAARDGQFILAHVVTDIRDGPRSLGYQGSVLNMTINADKQITAIVLEEARAFYLRTDDDTVTHIPIPRDKPFAQLYLDGPQIKNIAFEVYALED
jgi:hypothetical protein